MMQKGTFLPAKMGKIPQFKVVSFGFRAANSVRFEKKCAPIGNILNYEMFPVCRIGTTFAAPFAIFHGKRS
jgi:hypothetical protein